MPRRVKTIREPVELVPHGAVVAEGVIPGRATPWKAPTIGRNGGAVRSRGYCQYKAWQKTVNVLAGVQRLRRRPYGGPVRLEATFYLRPHPNGAVPDVCNLAKAFEDALQGVAYRNDSQVSGHCTHRVITATEPERVEYRVIAEGGAA
jgi:Holliday junction resolvase RusA-like endonuclease